MLPLHPSAPQVQPRAPRVATLIKMNALKMGTWSEKGGFAPWFLPLDPQNQALSPQNGVLIENEALDGKNEVLEWKSLKLCNEALHL